MNQPRPNAFVPALLINIVLFGATLMFSFPIFNSGDDVYLMYLCGGGFGQAPTELLHYHYGMHPYLGLLLKNLFVQFPRFNWYAALLYAFHFVSCTAWLYQLRKWNSKSTAIFIYLLVFFCIEARFLLQPSFTNTALVTAMAGVLLLHDALKNYTTAKLVIGSLLVIFASMLRLHLLIPAVAIAAPFFVLQIRRSNVGKIILHAACLAAIIAGFVFLQQDYYTKHIPGWQQEESYRQTVINYYNVPKKPISPQSLASFIENGLIFDYDFLSEQKIKELTAEMKLPIAWQAPDFREKLHWLTIENRSFILLALLFLYYKFPQITRRQKIAVLISAAIVFGICVGLLLFRKLPPYVIPGCLLIWIAFTTITSNEEEYKPPARGCFFTICSLLLLYWSVVRLDKLNDWNIQQHKQFACAYKVVNSAPDKLFVVTDDKFPIDYFHVWGTPQQFPMKNLLYKDHLLNRTFESAREKLASAIITPHIYYIGSQPELIQQYIATKFHLYLALLNLEHIKCIPVSELVVLEITAPPSPH